MGTSGSGARTGTGPVRKATRRTPRVQPPGRLGWLVAGPGPPIRGAAVPPFGTGSALSTGAHTLGSVWFSSQGPDSHLRVCCLTTCCLGRLRRAAGGQGIFPSRPHAPAWGWPVLDAPASLFCCASSRCSCVGTALPTLRVASCDPGLVAGPRGMNAERSKRRHTAERCDEKREEGRRGSVQDMPSRRRTVGTSDKRAACRYEGDQELP
jgi:hypothetical protein